MHRRHEELPGINSKLATVPALQIKRHQFVHLQLAIAEVPENTDTISADTRHFAQVQEDVQPCEKRRERLPPQPKGRNFVQEENFRIGAAPRVLLYVSVALRAPSKAREAGSLFARRHLLMIAHSFSSPCGVQENPRAREEELTGVRAATPACPAQLGKKGQQG